MQILVIGAGVVGLAVARAAALAGHEVVVAEQASGIGSGISSRNSEVIHAGMYYPTGSLRAIHCARGRRMLYAYCAAHDVPHRKCGKLIVATNAAEEMQLATIERQGEANGIEGLTMLDAPAARRLEPALSCIAALHSAQTGIIDGHAFMLALEGDLESRRHDRVPDADRKVASDPARLGRPVRRAGAGPARDRRGGECGGAFCAGAGAGDRGPSGRSRPAPRVRQRQL